MAMTLITTNTETNAASSSFTSSIDSTYKLYIFKFINLNPATDDASLTFQCNATDTADYNDIAMTTTIWVAYNQDDGSGGAISLQDGRDQAAGTNYQDIAFDLGNGADECASGTFWLFNPSNTTYMKHWYSRVTSHDCGNFSHDTHAAGYLNDTTAIDDIQFKMSSGNFDGTIKMYGV